MEIKQDHFKLVNEGLGNRIAFHDFYGAKQTDNLLLHKDTYSLTCDILSCLISKFIVLDMVVIVTSNVAEDDFITILRTVIFIFSIIFGRPRIVTIIIITINHAG